MRQPLLYICALLPGLLLWHVQAFSQDLVSEPNGNFTVDFVKGCASLTVTVNNTSGLDPNQVPSVYKFDYKPGDPLTLDTTQSNINPDTTYTVPGTYTILQIIGTSNPQIDSITVEVLEPLSPTYKVYNCINHSVYIDFSQENYYDLLRIDYGDNTIDTVAVSEEFRIHQYTGGTFDISVEGIFEEAQSNCAVRDTTITTIEEPVIASISQVQVLDQSQIQIHYDFPNPHVAYRLEIAENGDTDFNDATFELAGDSDHFTIEGLSDTRQNYYCFRIASVNRCDESLNLYSDTLCSIALQATADHLVNQLSWETNTVDFPDYEVYRDSELLTTTSSTNYEDNSVVCQQVYAYQVTGEKNGMQSLSELISLTALSTDIADALASFTVETKGGSMELSVDGDEAPQGTTLYYIYRQAGSAVFELYDSLEVSGDVEFGEKYTYTDDQVVLGDTYCYQISYQDLCGNESRLSAPACAELPKQGRILFPNAFTPNGDGLNDIFIYKGNLIEQIELHIFNRWGELVYHTDQLDEGWDGTYRGVTAPQGTYVYKVSLTDRLGNQMQQQGSFVLLIP